MRRFNCTAHVDGPKTHVLELASDSTTTLGSACYGYVISNGMFGLASFPHPPPAIGVEPAAVAELQAIGYAMKRIPHVSPVTVYTRSQVAIGYLYKWQRGIFCYPEGYSLQRNTDRIPTLVALATKLHERPGSFDTQWVESLNGHPLNELARSLTGLARKAAHEHLTKEEAKAQAKNCVSRCLTRM